MIRRSSPMIAWTEFLGGMDQDTFETLFGIDHERLTQAGEEIRTGQGRLGELLFAAGAGLAGLSQAQKTLQQGLDELFKPRGQNPRINKAVSEFHEAQEELKRYQLPSEDVAEARPRLCARRSRAAEQIREQIRAARGEQAGLKRIKSAIPLVARRRRLTRELDELGTVIRLRDDFGAEFRKGKINFSWPSPRSPNRAPRSQEIDARLAELDLPRMLLDAANEIESLQERLGTVEKASLDRVKSGELAAGLPSTRRGGSSASWVARSIWTRPRRSGSGSMSRR